MEQFENKKSYLVKNKFDNHIHAITIHAVTKKGYQIFWHNGGTSWELKDNFDKNHELIEDISDYIPQENTKRGMPPSPIPKETNVEYVTDFTQCYVCHGEGTVPDPKSTAGKTVCPYCQGAKMIAKSFKRKINL